MFEKRQGCMENLGAHEGVASSVVIFGALSSFPLQRAQSSICINCERKDSCNVDLVNEHCDGRETFHGEYSRFLNIWLSKHFDQ